MGNSIGNNPTKVELEDEWNRLCFSGEIKSLDRLVLKAVFENPTATMRELADIVGCDHSVVVRRLNRPAVIKARQLFEGTFSDQMHAAAGKFIRWINRTLDDEEADQRLVLEAGKVSVGFLAKEAEMQLRSKEAGQAKTVVPMSVEAAKEVLDADFVMQPDEPITVEDL